MFTIIVLGLLFFAVWRFIDRLEKQGKIGSSAYSSDRVYDQDYDRSHPASEFLERLKRKQEELDQREAARAEARALYAWVPGTPRYHWSKKLFLKSIPGVLLALIPFGLTVYFMQAMVPIVLMGLTSLTVIGVMFLHFNREERKVYNQNLRNNEFVEESAAKLDEFFVPDEWVKKHL